MITAPAKTDPNVAHRAAAAELRGIVHDMEIAHSCLGAMRTVSSPENRAFEKDRVLRMLAQAADRLRRAEETVRSLR